MYGQPAMPRPEALQKADEDFVKKASAGFGGSREAASRAWAAEGDRFLSELNLDYAMRRYNQSWLLNPANYQPYWGFARVMVQSDRFTDAIRYFEMAEARCDDRYQKVALLSDMGTAHSFARNFRLANEQFRKSTTLDPNYASAWLRWSQSLYREGNYAEAWDKLKRARSLGGGVPEPFIRELRAKMPEPK
jgi:tetratricopeptide (TPR) repeat protein